MQNVITKINYMYDLNIDLILSTGILYDVIFILI